jgi:hypothetical protein
MKTKKAEGGLLGLFGSFLSFFEIFLGAAAFLFPAALQLMKRQTIRNPSNPRFATLATKMLREKITYFDSAFFGLPMAITAKKPIESGKVTIKLMKIWEKSSSYRGARVRVRSGGGERGEREVYGE